MPDPNIIYEDKDLLAVDKPAGLLVHGARVSDKRQATRGKEDVEPTLVDWLLARYPEIKMVGDDPATRPGIVHRLDKDTSGVMLVARNQKTFEHLKSLFQRREIQKTYLAVVRGVPNLREGTIDRPIGIKNGTLKRSVRSTKMRKDAVTEYKVLKTFVVDEVGKNSRTPPNPSLSSEGGSASGGERRGTEAEYSLLEVMPKTGRTHQIRVHLASIGHPIVGDPLYGPKPKRHPPILSGSAGKDGRIDRLMLHALSITFEPQPGTMLTISTESPFGDQCRILNEFY
jgi:23S rRNA pseudouridine1911/1915/1917 synthase